MTLRILPKPLNDAIGKVIAATRRGNDFPILSHILLTTSDGMLKLCATNLDIEISTQIDCDGELPAICVPADRLQSIVARLTERGETTLAMEGNLLAISVGRSHFTMPTLDESGFPSLNSRDESFSFEISGTALAILLNACAPAMASSDARPYLNGVYLFTGTIWGGIGNKICAVATDANILSAREIAVTPPGDMPAIIIPNKTVQMLVKMIEGVGDVSLSISKTRIVASFGTTRMISKLEETTYPDWRILVPEIEPCVTFDNTELVGAIATAFSAVKGDKKVLGLRVEIGEEETEFTSKNLDGTAGGSDACRHSLLSAVPDRRIGVAPADFLTILAALDGETIQFAIPPEKGPILMTAIGLEDRLALISPMLV